MINTLLLLEDKFNDENIMLTKAIKPQKVIYLVTKKALHAGYYHDYLDIVSSELPKVIIEPLKINQVNHANIRAAIERVGQIDSIHMTSSNDLLLILVEHITQSYDTKRYFTDIDQNRVLEIGKEQITVAIDQLQDLGVDSYIEMTGGRILHQTTLLNEDSNVMLLTDFIAENQTHWKPFKRLLMNSRAFQHVPKWPKNVHVDLNKFNRSEYNQFKWMLTFLKHINYVKVYTLENNVLDLKFKTPEHKHFLFIVGSWLESLTYHTVKMVDHISDIQTGVTFSWQSGDAIVKNEIDVLTTYQGKLFCFSCKDTAKYDVSTLNELAIYAERIGGEHTQKIIVSTQLPTAFSVVERAKQMDIKLIIYDGNPMTFRRQIKQLLQGEF